MLVTLIFSKMNNNIFLIALVLAVLMGAYFIFQPQDVTVVQDAQVENKTIQDCMPTCIESGKTPPQCAQVCGLEQPPKDLENKPPIDDCMPKCIESGKKPPECMQECGITQSDGQTPGPQGSKYTPLDTPVSNQLKYEDSPFGVFAAYGAYEYTEFMQQAGLDELGYWDWAEAHMKNLGAHWTRSNVQLIWGIVEPQIGGEYVFDNPMMTDDIITRIYDSEYPINWLGVFAEGGRNENDPNPIDYPEDYKRFVRDMVERYDGDGIDDASLNVRVKYWQAGNEVMGWERSGRTAEEYMDFVRLIREASKGADPDSKLVLIAPLDGVVSSEFVIEVITGLADEDAFDAIDIHHWQPMWEWKMSAVQEYRRLLNSLGMEDVEIWSCEHGTWEGEPQMQPIDQTQRDQAASLIMRYAYNLGHDVDKIMWNNLVEWWEFSGNPASIFNSMGVISDGNGQGEDTNTFNIPRLSYYSYKLLVEKLDGSDWDNVVTISENDEVYAYKYLKQGEPVWVVWWDYFRSEEASKEVTLQINADYVTVTEAIPKYDSGKDVVSYITAFNVETVQTTNGQLTLSLSDSPLYIEV